MRNGKETTSIRIRVRSKVIEVITLMLVGFSTVLLLALWLTSHHVMGE